MFPTNRSNPGSAHRGAHEWASFRLLSLALVPLALYVLYTFFAQVVFGYGYISARAWAKGSLTAVVLFAFVGFGTHHALHGLQVVVEDYVHAPRLKGALMIFVRFVIGFLGLAGLLAVLRLYLGA